MSEEIKSNINDKGFISELWEDEPLVKYMFSLDDNTISTKPSIISRSMTDKLITQSVEIHKIQIKVNNNDLLDKYYSYRGFKVNRFNKFIKREMNREVLYLKRKKLGRKL